MSDFYRYQKHRNLATGHQGMIAIIKIMHFPKKKSKNTITTTYFHWKRKMLKKET